MPCPSRNRRRRIGGTYWFGCGLKVNAPLAEFKGGICFFSSYVLFCNRHGTPIWGPMCENRGKAKSFPKECVLQGAVQGHVPHVGHGYITEGRHAGRG